MGQRVEEWQVSVYLAPPGKCVHGIALGEGCGQCDLLPDDRRSSAYKVYGDLARRHMYAMRDDKHELRERIWDAIELFRELYPEQCALWDDDYSN
jgi:hypothetical protein